MSTPTVLPAAALAHLAGAGGDHRGGPVTGWAPATGGAATAAPAAAGTTGFVRPALVRATLCLLPVPFAAAASEPLGRVPWPVPVAALVLGWGTAAALGLIPGGRYRRAGTGSPGGAGAAHRSVLAGFAAVTAAWSVLLALAPAHLTGTDRPLAYAVSLSALVLVAALAAALATGAERIALRWSGPALLVAGAMIATWPSELAEQIAALPPWVGEVLPPAEVVLLAAIGVMVLRVLSPLALVPRSWTDLGLAMPSIREVGWWNRGMWLALALSQAAGVVLVWRVSHATFPAAGPPPALVPLLLSIPLTEVLVEGHRARLAAGLAAHDDRERYLRYARRLGWAALAALLPPLVAGAALAGTATHLPYGLSTHPDAPALVLALAAGVLLAGLVAVGRLLAARDRPGLGAIVTGGAVAGSPALVASVPGLAATSLSGWGPLLPAMVIALAVAYAAGLVLAAHVLFDTRSQR